MNSKSPLASVYIKVAIPKYYLGPMKAQSKKLPGCCRTSIGSESHFARVMIERDLKYMNVNLNAIRDFELREINALNKSISSLR